MKDYNSPIYDSQREIIEKYREKGESWERILFGRGENEKDLEVFLDNMSMLNFWEITAEDWKNLVRLEQEGEEKRLKMSYAQKSSIIGESDEVNDIVIPKSKSSCWQKYKKYLLEEQGFLREDVKAIESSSLKILKRLNSDTKGTAIKGLVVGNVQSGKTANMAALMSMAADYGWNMFIVLSGTIENLRVQTLERLIGDLNRDGCNLTWTGISRPSKKCSIEDKAQSQSFEPGSANRYLTVCLKNSTRLRNLLQWLHEDEKSAAMMKIMVIDDESDQAGINTKNVDKEEKTKISELITNLVANRNEKGEETETKFAAMNYIGYTATPYANVLNEAGEDSLYPRDFISTLQVSKTYFGPQQIFGDRNDGTYPGLDIVREVSQPDLQKIKDIHAGIENELPDSMSDAICWFLCCVAAQRYNGYKKPVSMLVHTSQMQKHHEQIHRQLKKWFKRDNESIIQSCRKIWEEECNQFTKEDLLRDYPEFAKPANEINDYPPFDDIEHYLREMLQIGTTNIKLSDEGTFNYSKGLHICVDDSKNKGIKDDGTHMRLVYPDKNAKLDYASAFIVIGGATLSRGLTIEGLVSTYFLRSSKQGDTLMQMGRWFGYRRGYELLQRLWITDSALNQFEFLSDMDSELRAYIAQMELFNKSPKDYAVVIKQSPSTRLLRISAKNKMQSAVPTEMNYSGMHSQTDKFIEAADVLKNNYAITERFVESLGPGVRGNGKLGSNSWIWRGIPFDYIYDNLLSRYRFHEKLMAFSDLEAIKTWIKQFTDEQKLDKWNIVLFGLDRGKETVFAGHNIHKVQRTRKFIRDNTINLGVLTDPKEKVADVEYDRLSEAGRKMYDNYRTDQAQNIRIDGGLEITPSMVIYVVDKDSKVSVKKENSKRHDLNAAEDVIGISLNIPGERINEDYACSVIIDLKKYGLGSDIEGEDEYED